MKKNASKNLVEWSMPRWLLWLSLTYSLSIFVLGISWLIIKFDFPLFHSGDRTIIYLIVILWWVLSSIAIWGWRIKKA